VDAAYYISYRCYMFRGLRVCLAVCVGHIGEYCKTAEPIEMSFGGANSRGSKEPCIRWVAVAHSYQCCTTDRSPSSGDAAL